MSSRLDSPSGEVHAAPAGGDPHDALSESIIDGFVEAVAELGYEATTLTEIAKRTGISRWTFYQHFDSKEECLVAAFEEITSQMHETIEAACEDAGDWPNEVKAGVGAMLRFLSAKPSHARFCIVEVISSPPAAIDRYEEVMIPRLTPFLADERIDCSAESLAALPRSIRETLGGGILWILYQRIKMGLAERLVELEAELVEFCLTPYLGPDEARNAALEQSYEPVPSSASLERLLQHADEIRARHQPSAGSLTAAELIREDRER
jgi:AcrR family transcriptional regulator